MYAQLCLSHLSRRGESGCCDPATPEAPAAMDLLGEAVHEEANEGGGGPDVVDDAESGDRASLETDGYKTKRCQMII